MRISNLILIALFITLGCSKSDNTSEEDTSNLSLPVVTLSGINDITFISATGAGEVTDDGGSQIIAKGLCWSLLPDPDLTDSTTDQGGGAGIFSSELTSLDVATGYNVRAYATNSAGTAYSDQQSFTTLGKILVGGIQMTTQAEVDAFGSNNYTHIYGNVRLLDQVTDLSPLSSIIEVHGQLVIGEITNLLDLNGLNNLALVRDLHIRDNLVLTNLDDLESLTILTGHFLLSSNNKLTNIEGLGNVVSIEGYIWIRHNNTLPNINGLENITSVNDILYIESNPLLENIHGLSNLETINGNLRIYYNDILANLNGLSALTIVDGYFHFEGSDAITNLDPLSNLVNVSGYMSFKENPQLVDFCGVTPLLTGDGLGGSFGAINNGYNPTKQDIINGNCSL